jgi:hypothetical protein
MSLPLLKSYTTFVEMRQLCNVPTAIWRKKSKYISSQCGKVKKTNSFLSLAPFKMKALKTCHFFSSLTRHTTELLTSYQNYYGICKRKIPFCSPRNWTSVHSNPFRSHLYHLPEFTEVTVFRPLSQDSCKAREKHCTYRQRTEGFDWQLQYIRRKS